MSARFSRALPAPAVPAQLKSTPQSTLTVTASGMAHGRQSPVAAAASGGAAAAAAAEGTPPAAYVYSGPGAGTRSVLSTLHSLRKAFVPAVKVASLGTDELLEGAWRHGCLLLVMPGGADLPYCKHLNGRGNALIREWVEGGGAYLGLCAGAYYACSRVEFEPGTRLEVVGDRELSFFPGTAKGSIYPGFCYESEKGAVAAPLRFRCLDDATAAGGGGGDGSNGSGSGGSGGTSGSSSGNLRGGSGVRGTSGSGLSGRSIWGSSSSGRGMGSRVASGSGAGGGALESDGKTIQQVQQQQQLQQQQGWRQAVAEADKAGPLPDLAAAQWVGCVDYVNGGPAFRLPGCAEEAVRHAAGAGLVDASSSAAGQEQQQEQEQQQQQQQINQLPQAHQSSGAGHQQQQQQHQRQQRQHDLQHQQHDRQHHHQPQQQQQVENEVTDWQRWRQQGIEVLATYPEHGGVAAALFCHVGGRGGRAVLCGTHPELHPSWLGASPTPGALERAQGGDMGNSSGGIDSGGGSSNASASASSNKGTNSKPVSAGLLSPVPAQSSAPPFAGGLGGKGNGSSNASGSGGAGSKPAGCTAAVPSASSAPAFADSLSTRAAAASALAADLTSIAGHVERLQAALAADQAQRWRFWRSLLVAAGLQPWLRLGEL